MGIPHKIRTEKIFSTIFKKNKELLVLYKIAQKWENLVKKLFVANTYPLKISKDKILFVAVANNSVGSQFYYSKEDVIFKTNLYLGYDAIIDIKTTLKPSKWNVNERCKDNISSALEGYDF
ncbi:MAG: DUF721 domain-containing protein [Rickettsiales bacterium]|nr:DUF721 domain-containing protein [Rickettsiales bacterium]